MSSPEKLSPMLQQYFEVKRSLPPGTLLLFRLGDFYELFFEDAELAAPLLGLTLTKRMDHPMAGLPYHAAEGYINKLLQAGRKVAICEQAEPAKAGKLVKRELTRILSPGTRLGASQVDAQRNQFLCAVHFGREGIAAAWLDLTTGEFQLAVAPRAEDLLPVLTSLAPAEVLVAEQARTRWRGQSHADPATEALLRFCDQRAFTELPGYLFEPGEGARLVLRTLGVLNLDGFGLRHDHPGLGPAGALVHYATENLRAKPEHLRGLREYRADRTLLLDPATLRNLEIFQSARGDREGTLYAAINRTQTPPGARLLERWLSEPILDLGEISRRQSIVGEFVRASDRLPALRDALAGARDLPRILGRLQNRLRNPRELGGVRDTLRLLPSIRAALATFGTGSLASGVADRIDECPDLAAALFAALNDELPAEIDEGGAIRAGHDAELDRLRSLTSGNRAWLSELERREQERTGIKSLKVRFTGNFGYYIEVTKANLHLVPADYVRRQTTVGGERYITEDLKQKEREIFHAEENALARERDLFNTLVELVLRDTLKLSATGAALAEIDLLAGWADLARDCDYCQPLVDESDTLEITEGRHPVVEQMLRKPLVGSPQPFVPNDTVLASDDAQIGLITGPNMAGKSTYIRQVALIALLAHVGCWVPARQCHVGRVDRIFSRVGANDDLARGNSTFMVEMNETANILNNATDRSLIILDEIGRGTSTYDGLSIAWAVVEHLHRQPERGPRTLFATHYQELTQLAKHLPRIRNWNVAVKEWNDEIVFTRRVVPGSADRSYGIQVARLAGLPLSVIERAKTILGKLESDDAQVTLSAPQARPKKTINVKSEDGTEQLSFL